ncbi:hypothetical protein [Planobispora rosea]|uniref:hypothetical protein n=1 Tax=Planobispora rosea TaxID=35762 RepID=UPI00083A7D16|nr:hypothetical protein [Planobispora rosea]
MDIARRAYGTYRALRNRHTTPISGGVLPRNQTLEADRQRIRAGRAQITRTTTKTTSIQLGGGTSPAAERPSAITAIAGGGTPLLVAEAPQFPALGAPAAGLMVALVDQVGEAMTRLARIPPARDIRNPIAQMFANAAIVRQAAATARSIHLLLIEDRHDPLVVAAAEEAAAALRIAADAAMHAAQTAAMRYQGAASDQARGTRLPDLRRF